MDDNINDGLYYLYTFISNNIPPVITVLNLINIKLYQIIPQMI